MRTIDHFHFLFSGFTQRFSGTGNGLGVCYRALRAKWPTSETIWLPWHCDTADLAAMVAQSATRVPGGRMPGITVAGYSFGGSTAYSLCEELYLHGLPVDYLCSIDAVLRRSVYPWGWLSAFNRTAKFKVPANVKTALVFYQTKDWPRGHHVRQTKGLPQKVDWIKLPGPHAAMDNHPLVTSAVMDHARSVHDVA